MRLNYVLIPLITIAVSVIGSRLTSAGMPWYKTIALPSWTPPGGVIGAVWTVIFILTTISALIVWNNYRHENTFTLIIGLFLVNAALNVGWSYLFFYNHLIGGSIIEMLLLLLSVVALIVLIKPLSTVAAMLLVPYACWVAFATYLTVTIYKLNAS